jgi:hypothetical protein
VGDEVLKGQNQLFFKKFKKNPGDLACDKVLKGRNQIGVKLLLSFVHSGVSSLNRMRSL